MLGLALTTDGGKTFRMVFIGESPAGGPGFVVLWAGFTSASRAYLLAAPSALVAERAHAAGQLWQSDDGARSWTEVRFSS